MFWLLFALPSPTKRYLPKCKSQTARSSAYDLLVEFVKGSVENYLFLHQRMLQQHTKGRPFISIFVNGLKIFANFPERVIAKLIKQYDHIERTKCYSIFSAFFWVFVNVYQPTTCYNESACSCTCDIFLWQQCIYYYILWLNRFPCCLPVGLLAPWWWAVQMWLRGVD